MSERPKKLWQILNAIPVMELQNASPEEVAEIHKKADSEEQRSKRLQRLMSRPISEVYDSEHQKKPSE